MVEFTFPEPSAEPPQVCPRCGRPAAVHSRYERAVHDWQQTFFPCVRLACCGRTFTTTPPGLRAGARYSERVIALARVLVGLGLSLRHTVRLLKAAGVPTSVETVRSWSRGVEPPPAPVGVDLEGTGIASIHLRPGLRLVFRTDDPSFVIERLRQAGAQPSGAPA
jgi:hypothetical protein